MRLPIPVTGSRGAVRRAARPLNVAHRGASAAAPENTLAALRLAARAGADLVEIDVRRTKDGALVALHDSSLARTTDVRRVFPGRWPWRVADFTHDELRRLDAGSWKSAEFAGEGIPTLTEAIRLARDTMTGLLVELKTPDQDRGVVADLAATLRPELGDWELDGPRSLVVQSFGFAAMKELRSLEPRVSVGLLGAPSRVNLPVLATWASQVNPRHLAADAHYVRQVQDTGMECMVWTVNHAQAMRRALRMGVDGVITDRPELLARLLPGEWAPEVSGQRRYGGADGS